MERQGCLECTITICGIPIRGELNLMVHSHVDSCAESCDHAVRGRDCIQVIFALEIDDMRQLPIRQLWRFVRHFLHNSQSSISTVCVPNPILAHEERRKNSGMTTERLN